MSGSPNPQQESSRFAVRVPHPLWFVAATIAVIVLALGVLVGVPIYRTHVAIQAIEEAGGLIGSRPRGPEWLRERLGNDSMKWFDEVTTVNLNKTDCTDDTVRYVSALTSLQDLRLDNTRVSDAGLVHLQNLTDLQDLALNN